MSDSLNFAQMYTNSTGDEALPAGQYAVRVTGVTHKVTSTGKPMLQLRAVVAGGPNDGKSLFDNMVITADNDKAMYYFFKDLEAHGIGKDFFATSPSLDGICAALKDTQATWDVSVQSSGAYAGRNEIKGKSKSAVERPVVAAQPQPAPQPVTQNIEVPAPAPDAEVYGNAPGF